MSKNILGPAIVSCCLIGTGYFHYQSTIGSSQYTDANKSVSELLSQNHFKPVSFDSSANGTWDQIVQEYKKNTITEAERLGKIGTTDEETREQLKGDCQEVIGKPTKSITTYNKTVRWCVIPQTTSERLTFKGKRALSLETGKDEDNWAGIASLYKDKTIDGFNLAGKSTKKDLEKAMIDGCKPLLEVKNWDKDFETKAERTEKLCSIRKQ